LIGGTRSGKNRLRIIRALDDQPRNANQLSNELDLDYRTVRHHLELLEENDVLETMGEGYGKTYFVTDRMEDNLDVLREIGEQSGLIPTDDER
jgi:DNA-binding transcriptional ArsR family regulator